MSKSSKAESSLDAIRRRLSDAGLRKTAARIAVLRHLGNSGKPLSHADVALALADQGFDKATVYRNLVELAEAGIISQFDLGDHVWRFEWRDEHTAPYREHPHFLCLDCGEISCLDDVTVCIAPPPGGRAGGGVDVTQVLLKGHCQRCR